MEMTHYPEVKRELQDSGVSPQDSGDSGVPPKDIRLCRSSRTRTQATKFSPKMTGQSHHEGVREGVGFPETAANSLAAAQEESSILPPDLYDTVRGVLNLETDEGEPVFSEIPEEDCETQVLGVLLAQHYNMKKAKELFGDRSDEAVMRELSQIHAYETYEPQFASSLTWEQKKEALNSLLFVTEKRDGAIKARQVADGSKQRTYDGYNKKDRASPTVLTERVFLTGVIDAQD